MSYLSTVRESFVSYGVESVGLGELDHLIIGDSRYILLKDRGII
jgi:hypothetical protein